MRLGNAYGEIHEHSLALSMLMKAALLEPHNADVRKQIDLVKHKMETETKKEKSVYFGMFSRASQ